MTQSEFMKRIKSLFWGILSMVLLSCATFLVMSYNTVQAVKFNDGKQDIQIEKKANKEMVLEIKKVCEEKLDASNKASQEKLDLILTFFGVDTKKNPSTTLRGVNK